MLEKYFWLAKDWGGDAFPKVNDMSCEYRGSLPKAMLVIAIRGAGTKVHRLAISLSLATVGSTERMVRAEHQNHGALIISILLANSYQ